MAKKRGLGKGLGELLGGTVSVETDVSSNNKSLVSIDKLVANPFQPRTTFGDGAIEALADSIRQHGIIQPLAVRDVEKDGEKHFEIIAGERRFRAAKLAGLDEVPVIVHAIDDYDSAALALIENIQREDLNAIEKAKGIKCLVDEFGLTHAECGKVLGQSRSAISNTLRLLELDEAVQQAVIQKNIDMGHARALLPLQYSEQHELLQQIQLKGLSVRETESLVRETQCGNLAKTTPRHQKSEAVKQTEIKLSEYLQTKVSISQQRGGSGKIALAFSDEETFEKLLQRLGLIFE